MAAYYFLQFFDSYSPIFPNISNDFQLHLHFQKLHLPLNERKHPKTPENTNTHQHLQNRKIKLAILYQWNLLNFLQKTTKNSIRRQYVIFADFCFISLNFDHVITDN